MRDSGKVRLVWSAIFSSARGVEHGASMMRKSAIFVLSLQVFVLSLFAAETPKECSLCVGATAELAAPPSAVIPLVLQIKEGDLATTPVDSLSPEQRSKLTVNIAYTVDRDKDPLLDVETHTKSIID